VSQPEESREKSAKTDDVLLEPVLKDLDDLEDLEDPEPATQRQHRAPERDRSDEDT